MCGQVHVDLMATSVLADLISTFERRGFRTEVIVSETLNESYLHCRKGCCDIVLELTANSENSGQTFAAVAYPPYSYWPWRWGHENRLFDEITSCLDVYSIQSDANEQDES